MNVFGGKASLREIHAKVFLPEIVACPVGSVKVNTREGSDRARFHLMKCANEKQRKEPEQ
jgi:hypothetical protein